MKSRYFALTLAIVLSGVVLLDSAYATAQDHQQMQMDQHPTAQQAHQHMQMGKQLKVGKRGEITLTTTTNVDGVVLQPGTYVIQHRVSGSNHFVRFVQLKQEETQTLEGNYTYTEQNKAGEVQCRVEPAEPVKETTAFVVTENGVQRIAKVAIKGENVMHVF